MSLLRKIARKGRRAFEKLEGRLSQTETPSMQVFASYAEAKEACSATSPYQDTDLVDVVFEKTVRYIKALPHDNFVSQNELNSLFFLTQLFSKDAITVIDIGGACGAHYFFLRKMLPDTVRLKYCVVETPKMAKKASQLTTDELSFHTDIKEAVQGGKVDVAIASGVIQYTPDPYGFLKSILDVRPGCISIHRTPFFEDDQKAVYIQKSRLAHNGIGPLPDGFSDRDVEYPETTMSLNKFRSILDQEYESFAEWDKYHDHSIPGRERLVFSSCYRLKK